MNLSQLLSKNHNITIKDEFFISKGSFELQSCYCLNVQLDLHYFSEITSDANSVCALLFEIDNHYYLCSETGSDGYRDYRSDIFEIKPGKITELKKALEGETNLISSSIEVVAKFDSIPEDNVEGLAFFVANFSEEEALIHLSCFCTDEYYPHAFISFNSEVYKNAFPVIEKKHLENKTQEVAIKTSIQKI